MAAYGSMLLPEGEALHRSGGKDNGGKLTDRHMCEEKNIIVDVSRKSRQNYSKSNQNFESFKSDQNLIEVELDLGVFNFNKHTTASTSRFFFNLLLDLQVPKFP